MYFNLKKPLKNDRPLAGSGLSTITPDHCRAEFRVLSRQYISSFLVLPYYVASKVLEVDGMLLLAIILGIKLYKQFN